MHKKRYALAPGTILTKTYKGRTYQVTVKGENAYEADMEDIRKAGDVEKAFFSVYREEEI